MSTGAVLVLISNDGKADQLIMATTLLHTRLDDVRSLRATQGLPDVNPTLADIERTHLLFMNATFKPFAAFGFEYQKVKPSSGSLKWGERIQFSIPQAGDFFADMGLHLTCDATTSTGTAMLQDHAGHRYTDAGGNFVGLAASPKLHHKWCDYPGERAVETGRFEVNGNALHEYTYHATAFWRKFKLPEGKKIAYARMCGHEVPQDGYGRVVGNVSGADASAGADTFGLSNTTPTLAHRKVSTIVNGLQTPKQYHPAATFWHKCQFWFNKDPRLMVPSVAIPYGQRFVDLQLAAKAAMVQCIGTDNIYKFADAAGTGMIASGAAVEAGDSLAPSEVNLLAASDSVAAPGVTTGFTGGDIVSADLYVNNVYVLPDIHDIYIHRIGFNLIRVLRQHTAAVTANTETNLQMNQLKWPIEAIYFGIQPDANVTPSSSSADSLTNWWRMSTVTRSVAFEGSRIDLLPADVLEEEEVASGNTLLSLLTGSNTVTAGDGVATPRTLPHLTDVRSYLTSSTNLGTVSFELHGVKLYNAVPASFFSDYMPVSYGGSNICSTEDIGSSAVFFGLYPGTYQPTGHINISRAREFHFITTPAVTGKLVLVADAINFLLISDGNAILRYTT